MSRDACVTLDTTQFISPEEFPLNHFRNLTRENKVTTSAAVAVQGSLCCYFFSQGHIWLTALTGHTSNTGHVYWNPQLSFTPVFLCSTFSLSTPSQYVSHTPFTTLRYLSQFTSFSPSFKSAFLPPWVLSSPRKTILNLRILMGFFFPFLSVCQIKTCLKWVPFEGPRQWEI